MDKEKLIKWIEDNEWFNGEIELFIVSPIRLKEAINNGAFEQEPCWYCNDEKTIYFKKEKTEFPYIAGFCPLCGRSLRKDVEE